MSSISLPVHPVEKLYEDYVTAIIQCGGYFVERGLRKREKIDLLELDVVATKITDEVDKCIVEIKSGKRDVGFGLIFKMLGWMNFLSLKKSALIVLKGNPEELEQMKPLAAKIGVNLLINLNYDKQDIITFFGASADENTYLIETLRFSYAVERGIMVCLNDKKAANQAERKLVRDYLFNVTEGSFFDNSADSRINKLFQEYRNNSRLTARIYNLLNGCSAADQDVDRLTSAQHVEIFREFSADILVYCAMYAEYVNRILIVKLCVENIVIHGINIDEIHKRLPNWLRYVIHLPSNLSSSIYELAKHPSFRQYPFFWQIFTYIFGGFIVESEREEEYRLLSEITKVPIEEIDNALSVFDLLFPLPNGNSWFLNIEGVLVMKFFPPQLAGMGVIFRMNRPRPDEGEIYISPLMQKWGNFTIEFLKKVDGFTMDEL